MCQVPEYRICPAACKSRLYNPYKAPGDRSAVLRYPQCRTVKAYNDAGRTDYPPVEEHDTTPYLVEGDVPCDACKPVGKRGRKRKDGDDDEDPKARRNRLAVIRGKRSRDKQGEEGVKKRRDAQRNYRKRMRDEKNQGQGGGTAVASKKRVETLAPKTAWKLGSAPKLHNTRPSGTTKLTQKAVATTSSRKKAAAKEKSAQEAKSAKEDAKRKEAAKKAAKKEADGKKATAKKKSAKRANSGSSLSREMSKLSLGARA